MKKVKFIILVVILFAGNELLSQIAINSDGSSPHISAGLDVSFTDRGFLPPRMTAAQREAITNPAVSLIIYCSDCLELQMYDGTDWVGIDLNMATEPNNQAPVASYVSISGTTEVGIILTGSYTYSDNENNPEATSLFQWYLADDASGTNQAAISGATSTTYLICDTDETKFISFEVIPVTNTGASPGNAVMSSYEGPIDQWNCGSVLYDVRDSKSYATIQIGTQCWMAENLNIGTWKDSQYGMSDDGAIHKYCQFNNTDNCDIYGGLYQWDEMMNYSTTPGAQGICPDGWHVPTDTEWMTLEEEVESTTGVNWNTTGRRGTDAGGNLKETDTLHWWPPNVGATNSSGFTALPGGQRNRYTTFYYLYQYSIFWTSSEYDYRSWLRFIKNHEAYALRNIGYKEEGNSVRCLKD